MRATGLAWVLAVCLVLTTNVAAEAAPRGPGYPIPQTGKAAGGWIGAHILFGSKVYRISPGAKHLKTRFHRAKVVSNVKGSTGPSLRETQRAAYILSVYGTRNDEIQAAAVDAAVIHLLASPKWNVRGSQGRKRIRATGLGGYVRSYAKTMLKRSKKYAGPATRRLVASTTTVGSASKVVFTIRNKESQAGLGGLPVTFRYPGTAAVTSYTNTSGQAVAYITPGASTGVVKATVAQVPDWRLRVRKPVKRRASAVAVAGAKLSLSSRAQVVAAGAQSVRVSNSATVVSTGKALGGRYSVAGGQGTRKVTRRVRGPFSTSSTSCTGGVTFSSATTLAANGAWALPTYKPAKSGYYRWTVSVGGNAYSSPATGCGAAVRVRKQASVTQFRLPGDTNDVKLDKKFQIGARIAGFDRTEGHTLTSRLYGPFNQKANVDCATNRQVTGKTVTRTVSTNGDFTVPSASIGAKANVGWYAWRTTLNTGDLIIGDTSTCGVLFKVSQ